MSVIVAQRQQTQQLSQRPSPENLTTRKRVRWASNEVLMYESHSGEPVANITTAMALGVPTAIYVFLTGPADAKADTSSRLALYYPPEVSGITCIEDMNRADYVVVCGPESHKPTLAALISMARGVLVVDSKRLLEQLDLCKSLGDATSTGGMKASSAFGLLTAVAPRQVVTRGPFAFSSHGLFHGIGFRIHHQGAWSTLVRSVLLAGGAVKNVTVPGAPFFLAVSAIPLAEYDNAPACMVVKPIWVTEAVRLGSVEDRALQQHVWRCNI
jgi:hypothetical protein